jgi:transcription elongation factor Elf1
MNISGVYKTQHGELTIAQNGDNITASYQENGVCSGKLNGNKVEGIWKNKKDQGLFKWTFDGEGKFSGKYKSGLESGPMRGKWDGNSNNSDSINTSATFSLSLDTTINEINRYIDEVVHTDESVQSSFIKSVVAFINENNEYYWWIPAIKIQLNNWQNRIDDEELNIDLSGLSVSGKDLDFNPYDHYRIYFDSREYLFSRDEDDDEPISFFETVMNIDGDFDNYEELITVCNDSDLSRYHKFVNKSKTILYCTICKSCEEEIDAEDLSELFLGVNFYERLSDVNDAIMGGDIANEIQEDVLLSFGINRKDYDNEEELWREEFLTNWENVAQELIDNDVFDNDYIS